MLLGYFANVFQENKLLTTIWKKEKKGLEDDHYELKAQELLQSNGNQVKD